MPKTVEENLTEIIESILPSSDLFIVEVKFSPNGDQSKLTVLIDGDKGVGIDECATISRQLGSIIEEQELIITAYNLEVSSSGLDQPLKLERQYKKNIGRDVRVLLKVTSADVLGKLESMNEEGLEIREQKKTKNKAQKSYNEQTTFVPFNEIQKTTILIQF